MNDCCNLVQGHGSSIYQNKKIVSLYYDIRADVSYLILYSPWKGGEGEGRMGGLNFIKRVPADQFVKKCFIKDSRYPPPPPRSGRQKIGNSSRCAQD